MGVLALTCIFLAAPLSDESSAASNFEFVPVENDYAKVSTSLSYQLNYTIEASTAKYVVDILDDDGNVVTAKTRSGTLYSSSNKTTISVTLPSTAGDYQLRITITEGETTYERYAFARAVDPIKLSVTLNNKSDISRSFKAYFYIKDGDEWKKLDDSGKDVTVPANGTYDYTYDYIIRDVEKTTFCVMADDPDIGSKIEGLGSDYAHTYYTEKNDYKIYEYVCIGILVVLVIVAIWIYRKPIRNRGKPKGRR